MISSYFDVITILFKRKQHFWSDVVKECSVRFHNFDDFGYILKSEKSFAIFLDDRSSLVE